MDLSKVPYCCCKCGNGTWRKPNENGDIICAKCNEKDKELKKFIKDYLIELGVIPHG